MVDLKIENGQVIDGSGSPGFFATVLVDGEEVSILRGDAEPHRGGADHKCQPATLSAPDSSTCIPTPA